MAEEAKPNQQSGEPIKLEKVYKATPSKIWQLWTTPEGIESWWAPEGLR